METLHDDPDPLSQQELVEMAVMELGLNVFVSGGAGTGKSYTLRRLVSLFRDKYGDDDVDFDSRVVVLCPTGLAASLVGGMTIHRFLGRGLANCASDNIIVPTTRRDRASKAIRKRIKNTQVVIFDEISMVSPRLFVFIDLILQSIHPESKSPFGGCQVIAVGDFLQLPPVPDTETDPMVESYYSTPNPVYSFQTTSWNALNFHHIHLYEPRRQANHLEFFDLLGRISVGSVSEEDDITLRNSSCSWPNDGIIPTTLHSLRRDVEWVNNQAYRELPTDNNVELEHQAKIFLPANLSAPQKKKIQEDVVRSFDSYTQVPFECKFKKGAQVMLIRNLAQDLVNGSRGVVESVDPVENKVVVRFISRGMVKTFTPELFPIHYQTIDGVRSEVNVYQFPLKLAWAITIHKSQGMTLDRVNLDCLGMFSSGQFYVALSRGRDLRSIHLVNYHKSYIKADPLAIEFLMNTPSMNERDVRERMK